MEKQRLNTFRMVMLAMMVAIGVVISPILRIEGMCPTAHLINIVYSVLMGPWYSLLCATMIGVIRMLFMGIPPLALTGAVFGAFLSGVFYRASGGKIICAVLGEIFGTGIIGSIVSYPVMAFIMGRDGLNAFFYTPMFVSATIMGGAAAYVFLKALSRAGLLAKFQRSLGAKVYDKTVRKSVEERAYATKENSPLIHCITNPISIHGCANMILAVGARPMMAEHPLEVEDITRTAGALMLNLGNITDARMESMRRSARVAMECGIPILLDLVGVTCSRIRMELARELIGLGRIQILKGNISELLAIAGQSFHGTGIDAGKEDAMTDENEEERRRIFRTFSQQTGSVLLATGARDLLVDQERCLILENGTTKLSGITGTGCMVGALTAAYLAQKDPFTAAVLGTSVMGIAGELAERSSKGPGSFQIELLDAVAGMRQEVLEAKLRIRETEA